MSWNWEDEADEEDEDFEELSEEGSLSWHLGNSEKKNTQPHTVDTFFFSKPGVGSFFCTV